jgi:hypothetical protein
MGIIDSAETAFSQKLVPRLNTTEIKGRKDVLDSVYKPKDQQQSQ